MFRNIQLYFLKRKLRYEYYKWQSMVSEVSCGVALSDYISPDAKMQKDKVDALLAKCKAIEDGKDGN